MKPKHRVVMIILTITCVTVATHVLIGMGSLYRIKEKTGQVSGEAIRERLRPLKTRYNKLSRAEKSQLSQMIRLDKSGPKKLEQLKKEYNKLPEQQREFLDYMVKAYPAP